MQFWKKMADMAQTRMGGGDDRPKISDKSKEVIRKHVIKYRDTAMSKNDIMKAIKAVYKFDQDAIEEIVNEEWQKPADH